MNWPVMTIFGIAAIALMVFLVIRNQKDQSKFENQLKDDYHKTKNEEGDVEIDSEPK